MKVDTGLFVNILLGIIAVAALVLFILYRTRTQKQHAEACFDAMLRMLLQPTPANISALDALLNKGRLSTKECAELLHQAEVEADCLSMMPTGEMRTSQPFLKRRYTQILESSQRESAVAQLVKSRLTAFSAA